VYKKFIEFVKIGLYTAILYFFDLISAQVVIVIALWYGSSLVGDGTLTQTNFVSFAIIATTFATALGVACQALTTFTEYYATIADVVKILRQIKSKSNSNDIPEISNDYNLLNSEDVCDNVEYPCTIPTFQEKLDTILRSYPSQLQLRPSTQSAIIAHLHKLLQAENTNIMEGTLDPHTIVAKILRVYITRTKYNVNKIARAAVPAQQHITRINIKIFFLDLLCNLSACTSSRLAISTLTSAV